MAWSRQTFWFQLDFLLPKNEISFEHFRVFSWTISKIFLRLAASRKSVKLFSNIPKNVLNWFHLQTTRNVRLDSGHYATKYYFLPFVKNFGLRKESLVAWNPLCGRSMHRCRVCGQHRLWGTSILCQQQMSRGIDINE